MHLYDLIDPVELTGVARLLLADEDRPENNLIMEQWFPPALLDDIDYTYSTGTDRTYTDAMPFRAWNTEAPIGRRPGRATVRGEMPPLSLKFPLTEYDRIRQRAANDGILAEALEGDVFGDIERGVRALRSRMAAAAASALVNGTVVIAENGVQLTVDFGRTVGNSMTVSNPWSNATLGTPLDDETTVIEYALDNQGIGPSDLVAMMNRTVINDLLVSDQYRNAAATLRVQERLSLDQLNEVRASHEMPQIVEYNARTADSSGAVAKQIPDATVVYVPRNLAIGETQYGVPAMATEGEVALERDDRPGPVAYMMRDFDPLTVWTVVDAIGVPLLKDPDATFVLDVS